MPCHNYAELHYTYILQFFWEENKFFCVDGDPKTRHLDSRKVILVFSSDFLFGDLEPSSSSSGETSLTFRNQFILALIETHKSDISNKCGNIPQFTNITFL